RLYDPLHRVDHVEESSSGGEVDRWPQAQGGAGVGGVDQAHALIALATGPLAEQPDVVDAGGSAGGVGDVRAGQGVGGPRELVQRPGRVLGAGPAWWPFAALRVDDRGAMPTPMWVARSTNTGAASAMPVSQRRTVERG